MIKYIFEINFVFLLECEIIVILPETRIINQKQAFKKICNLIHRTLAEFYETACESRKQAKGRLVRP